ncbi:MAG: hypothetical protein NC321_16110 [Clostridium sp.]|nr:hypothetical protein [Lachnospiraceae bacterium]MCM1254343.1 hypothetical protein [Clostridium sp.]
MKTFFYVEYGLYDVTALADAVESTEDNAAFADLRKIKDNIESPSYGTLEHNFFVLDGSKEEFPDDPDDLVYFSKDFVWTNNNYWYGGSELYAGDDLAGPIEEIYDMQKILIQFSKNHSSYGLTLHFLSEYPLEIEITWRDLSGLRLSTKKFYPDSLVYFCRNQIVDYGSIEIVFRRTLPYHNAKLQYIEYGTTVVWGGDIVKSARLVNETDPISDKIATDILTFDFVDKNNDFNIGNLDGFYKSFQRKQKLVPYEIVNGEIIPLGTFFLDNYSTTKNITAMSAIDYKGMLLNTDFKDGKIYNGEKAGSIIDEIMRAASISEYEIDRETYDTPVYGTLGIQSCQKALREVLFACGSIINTSRRTGIDIYKSDRKISVKIERSKKFSTTLKSSDYISDVNVFYKTWTLDKEVTEITKDIYGEGIHTIQFSTPAENVQASAGLILKRMPYYIVLKLDRAGEGEVAISGQKYISTEMTALSRIEIIKAGEFRGTKNFTGTLLNYQSAKRAADNILDYYQLQQIIQTKHLSYKEKAGDWAEVENVLPEHANFVTAIESLTTDLTGGFISTAKYRGYYKLTSSYYYTDDELYADEGMGAII